MSSMSYHERFNIFVFCLQKLPPQNRFFRSSRENQNHQIPQCTCSTKLLGEKKPKPPPRLERQPSTREWLLGKARWLLCVRRPPRHRRPPNNTYTYQIAEIQQKQHKRASSMSSSENFSSSR